MRRHPRLVVTICIGAALTACKATSDESNGSSASALTNGQPSGPGPFAPGCNVTADQARALGMDVGELTSGTVAYPVVASRMRALFNTTGTSLQVDSVAATPTAAVTNPNQWGEYCVVLDDGYSVLPDLLVPSRMSPGQRRIGAGEIGCAFKLSTESAFPPIRWGSDAQPTALAVPPGSCILLGASPAATGYDLRVTARAETEGVYVLRQPTVDHVFDCDDAMQQTPWSPWRNDSDRTVRAVGATIYAASPEDATEPARGAQVDVACLYVLDPTGAVTFSLCSPQAPLNVRGELSFAPVEVPPGWYLAAQATNRCATPSFRHWGWAAYVHVY